MNVNFSWNNELNKHIWQWISSFTHLSIFPIYFIKFIIIHCVQTCRQNIGSAFFDSRYKNQDKCWQTILGQYQLLHNYTLIQLVENKITVERKKNNLQIITFTCEKMDDLLAVINFDLLRESRRVEARTDKIIDNIRSRLVPSLRTSRATHSIYNKRNRNVRRQVETKRRSRTAN